MATNTTDLYKACKEIVDEIQTISSIRSAPEDPPDKPALFPFVVTYPESGTYRQGPARVMTGLHNILIELHVARKDLPRDYATIMNLIDVIPYELNLLLNDGGFSTIQTWDNIEYVLGTLMWNGVETLGVRYTMTEVKIHKGLT